MVKCESIAQLSRLCLAIPATSAPSKRIWSRVARIITLKRTRFKEELVARMMPVRENVRHLSKKHVKLAKSGMEAHLHALIEYELACLPPFHRDEDKNEIDVGQEDHLLDF